MRVKIDHRIAFDTAPQFELRGLRMTPQSGNTQTVHNWSVAMDGGKEEVAFVDAFGNETRLFSTDGESHRVTIRASGEIETRDTAGVVGPHRGFAPLWLFQAATPLTVVDESILALAEAVPQGADLERLHALMGNLHKHVGLKADNANATAVRAAGAALSSGQGSAEDQANIFIAAARSLRFPARFINGYIIHADKTAALHAWAEAHVDGLGWVAFDPVHDISSDDRYVRMAMGRDSRDAAIFSGASSVSESEGDASGRVTVDVAPNQ
jgi:transglutaminase-like putative cysteine protease